jgi:hypothetical protein
MILPVGSTMPRACPIRSPAIVESLGWLKRWGGRERGSRSTTQCWREGGGALQDGSKLSAEPGGWGAVDHVVVNRDGEVEDVTDHDALVDDACTLAEPAHDDEE